MSAVAQVEDGKIVTSQSENSLSNTSSASKTGMDKDSFLQLLVAQMKYQDPLEPTTNTEFVSQYAQFSQVEQMQNMAGSMDLQRASSLVGQYVYVKTTGSDGEAIYDRGIVDYVVYEKGKAMLCVNEQLYSMDDLDTVVDVTYQNAFDKALDFNVELNKLPSIYGVDALSADKIAELEKIYNEMTDYEKKFLTNDVVDLLNKYIEVAKDFQDIATPEDPDESGDTEDSGNTV